MNLLIWPHYHRLYNYWFWRK